MPMQATTTTPLFSAELTPHRALGAGGVVALVGLGALVLFLPALTLLSVHFVPIIMAMLVIIVGAAGWSYLALAKGKRREQIVVWANQIEWTATDTNGARTLRRFDPKTVRLLLQRDSHEKTIGVRLRSGTEEVEIGGFLHTDDKASFAKALGTALRKARAA